MTMCLALREELDKSIAQLEHEARPQEPLSFQLMHIDHLSDSIDNADGAVEMWGAIDSCLADFYISEHYCNVESAIQNNRIEIIPELHKLVNETYEFICTDKTDDEEAVEALRAHLISRVDELSRFVNSCS